jgi:uncharacterized membrane protein (UPF0136 family)
MVSIGQAIAISKSPASLPRFQISGLSQQVQYKFNPNARYLSLLRSRSTVNPIFLTLATTSPADVTDEVVIPNIGGGDFGESGGGDGGNGGGGGGGDNNDGEGGFEESEDKNKKTGMSMSQKLTLGYATLVGIGGLMGYIKSGSQKSAMSGGFSALLLYYVYTQLPSKPVFASAIGLGMSAALLVVMGSRFKKSGKVFPAGVVALVSFVMSGGYVHGIMRSFH